MTLPNTPEDTRTPTLGVAYPFKIGKSLRVRRSTSSTPRELLSLKFTHMPSTASLQSVGALSRTGDKLNVRVPTHEAAADEKAITFQGVRRTTHENATVGDYVLVFVNGAMWLERANDTFVGIKPIRGSETWSDQVSEMELDDLRADPDSWTGGGDDDSGSPITPEGNEGMEEDVVNAPSMRHMAGKSPPNAQVKRISAKPTVVSDTHRAFVSPQRAAAPTAGAMGMKSLAGKGLSAAPAGRRRTPATDDDDDDDVADASSSEDDDSDSDDSDSDSDSAEYTDRSSDEE